jgi:hypothetical protein
MKNTVRQLVVVIRSGDDTTAHDGDVETLARLIRDREYGDYDVCAAYAAHDGELVAVSWSTDSRGFDADDYESVTVTVRFPDGGVEHGFYTVDGRA